MRGANEPRRNERCRRLHLHTANRNLVLLGVTVLRVPCWSLLNALQTAPKTVDNISTMLPSHHTISNPFKCRILSSLRSPKRTPLISASPRSLQTLHALPLFRFFEQNTSQKWTPTFPKRCQKHRDVSCLRCVFCVLYFLDVKSASVSNVHAFWFQIVPWVENPPEAKNPLDFRGSPKNLHPRHPRTKPATALKSNQYSIICRIFRIQKMKEKHHAVHVQSCFRPCLLHGFSFGHSSWPNLHKHIQTPRLSTSHCVSLYFPTLLDFHGLPLDNRFVNTVYPTCGRTTLASRRLFWPHSASVKPESNVEIHLSTEVQMLRIVVPPFFHLSLLITLLFTPADSLERSLYSATILLE